MQAIFDLPDKQQLFDTLRSRYRTFYFRDYTLAFQGDHELSLTFHFSIDEEVFFNPPITLTFPEFIDVPSIYEQHKVLVDQLVFNIGLIELISYWKVICPPQIELSHFQLSPQQIEWWKKLYFHGLGEMLYLNGIETNQDDLLEMLSTGTATLKPIPFPSQENRALIPIGGGKDSLTTLEILREMDIEKFFLVINPIPASNQSIEMVCREEGYDKDKVVRIKRVIDPELLRLNQLGYLNGHTPFSAMLAFYTSLVSVFTGSRYAILSNESSASEPSIIGTKINHQYSKSLEFENDYNAYLHRFISPDLDYFSLLRPLNEFQIMAIFSRQEAYLPVFRSCNVGSKKGVWCLNCPKCLFVFILLAAHRGITKATAIFGENLFAKGSLLPVLKELVGKAPTKPFECIGTIEEIVAALSVICHQEPEAFEENALLRYFRDEFAEDILSREYVLNLYQDLAPDHLLKPRFYHQLKQVYDQAKL
jgi:hypothetical protein